VRLGFCMVRSLNQKEAEQLVDRRSFGRIAASRTLKRFASIEEVWRCAGIAIPMLRHIAAADGFSSLGLSRRAANWAIKALRDDPLPLFAIADDKEGVLRPEAIEPDVELPAMTMGRQVVEDYRSIGLSLRAHPVAFLRQSLQARGYHPCSVLRSSRDGSRVSIAGLVQVRQMPGSAKGVMFITLEDEASNANLIVWPSVFEKNRRTILGATLLGCRGKVQRADDVIHLIVEHVADLTPDLKRISGLDAPLPGRGDEAKHGGHEPDSREPRPIAKPRDIYVPDLHIDTLKVKARNFR
jgi:error-prone DNA polymerase